MVNGFNRSGSSVPPVGRGRLGNEQSKELVLKRIRDIPSLPEVVQQLIGVLGKASTPASEIARLVSYDPGLTSRVLRMVNSAAYGVQRQVSSLQHAVMLLGFNTVRGLVLSASIFKLLEAPASGGGAKNNGTLDPQAFWQHALLTALLAKRLAEAYQLPEREEAFSAGMLHDVGKLVLDQYFSPEYRPFLKKVTGLGQPLNGPGFLKLEATLLGTTHTEIGFELTQKWRLPNTLTEVIRLHHQPEAAVLAPKLTYCVALANEVANQLAAETEAPQADLKRLSASLQTFFVLEEAEELAFLQQTLSPETLLQDLEQVALLLQSFNEAG